MHPPRPAIASVPAGHSAEFQDGRTSLLDFAELHRRRNRSPRRHQVRRRNRWAFWEELAEAISRDSSGRSLDFINIDGGEGGTGAGPLAFTDHVALPFKLAFTRVYREFALREVHRRLVWIGSGKLGFPESALFAFAVGCDLINVAREAMLAIGCIQAQRCHTDHCPTGVATQNRWLVRGLDPGLKSARVAAYIRRLRYELLALSRACGADHPSEIDADRLEVLDAQYGSPLRPRPVRLRGRLGGRPSVLLIRGHPTPCSIRDSDCSGSRLEGTTDELPGRHPAIAEEEGR